MQQSQNSSILSDLKEEKGKETGESEKEVEDYTLTAYLSFFCFVFAVLDSTFYFWSLLLVLPCCLSLYLSFLLNLSSYVHQYTSVHYTHIDVIN